MRYLWTALFSLILLITIVKTLMEMLMGPGGKICMGLYGPITAKADDTEF